MVLQDTPQQLVDVFNFYVGVFHGRYFLFVHKGPQFLISGTRITQKRFPVLPLRLNSVAKPREQNFSIESFPGTEFF
ncbi:ORF1100 [White spot syndrome virus]|uniref:ORF1100 n=1 Tax=White spot syndrome virus TaxID=342409 RepID=A0A2D3I679_9VIRU|nr:ORF1100 [White spot syndrome virus]